MRLLFIILTTFCLTSASAQTPFTVMAYNLLNFESTSSDRTPYFKTIMDSIQPDILVLEEVASTAGLTLFKNEALNGFYNCGTHIPNGNYTTQAVCYKINRFKFISNTAIKTDLRDINEFKLVHLETADTLRVYGVHLKASDSDSDAAERGAEIQKLRQVTNALTEDQHWIICGDFNFYRSSEPGYLNITNNNSTVNGNAIDVNPLVGEWGTFSYAKYHTQSPRTRNFGGGVNGGMDDRFDLIMHSKSVENPGGLDYVTDSHVALGNDGNHYNDSINEMPNSAVSQAMANALHYASDHLPILAKYVYNPVGIQEYSNPVSSISPNPTDGEVEVNMKENNSFNYSLTNVYGQVLLQSAFSGNKTTIDLSNYSKGIYFLIIGSGSRFSTQRIVME